MEEFFNLSRTENLSKIFIDARLRKEDLRYIVFVISDTLIKISLTDSSPRQVYANREIAIVGGRPTIDGNLLSAGHIFVAGLELFVIDATRSCSTPFLPLNDVFTIGHDASHDIQVDCDSELICTDDKVVIDCGHDFFFFNEKKIISGGATVSFDIGDRILTPNYFLERTQHQWLFTSFGSAPANFSDMLIEQDAVCDVPADFPEFRRSPRINLEPPTNEIHIQKIEAEQKGSKNTILRTVIPPLGMLMMTGLVTVISGRNPLMMLSMGFMSLMTAAFTASQYFTDKKERKIENRLRVEQYDAYLLSITAKIARLFHAERNALFYKSPSPGQLIEMVHAYNKRIYERLKSHKDFLQISLGSGDLVSRLTVVSNLDESDMSAEAGRVRKIVGTYSLQRGVPIVLDIAHQIVGVVAQYNIARNAISDLLFQIAFFHSYRDVNFIALVPHKSFSSDWSLWRFLPHFKLRECHTRGFVYDERTRDLVLNGLYQILTKRRQARIDKEIKNLVFTPHYIFTIFDDSYLAGHPIAEFLAEDTTELGMTVVWCKEDPHSLPETVTALVLYRNRDAGTLVNDHEVYVNQDFKPYPARRELEPALRKLANLKHVEVEKNSIPRAVTFLEMYKVKKVEQLNIVQRWSRADASKTLAVPLGLRGKNDLLELNLHERAHGPHGLIAGTTGSGKSEIVLSYLLSLAVNFAPEDVGFLPIDFKGGGMANLFEGLPHLLGAITNLDGASSVRALASIRAELNKRQRLFKEFGVNHINGYTRLYKIGKAQTATRAVNEYPTQPLPHLFLVSDEFAELKAHQPDFMNELVSAARIGRSLGVHLILATQKPTGVVSEQIWSNSRFKLALKVADAADSKEIIKTPDAATIVEPGRAYLQVGNNEIYELFQSAWSGAQYNPDYVERHRVDERIYLVNDIGQYELWTNDLSDDETIEVNNQEKITELDATVSHIARAALDSSAVLPQRPWLPPLSNKLVTPEVWRCFDDSFKIPLALLDKPHEQSQEIFYFDMKKMSHTAIFASPGYGKSTALQTIVMNLARLKEPRQLHFNLLDFGTNGLFPVKNLPHVADIVTLEETEKLGKMLGRISTLLADRKNLFKSAGVTNLTQYQTTTFEQLPIIVTVLDNYDAVSQSDQRELIDDVLLKLLREGASLGLYLVITANRSNSIRLNMSSNIQTKMVLYMNDESDVATFMGHDRLIQTDIPGRGQVELEIPTAFQIYFPAAGENSSEILSAFATEISVMAEEIDENLPDKIPMVPAKLSLEPFNSIAETRQWLAESKIPLGLSYRTTNVIGLVPGGQPFFLMAPADDDQMLLFQLILLRQLQQTGRGALLSDFADSFGEAHDFLDGLQQPPLTDLSDSSEINKLLTSYVDAAQRRENLASQLLIIADLETFMRKGVISDDDFIMGLRNAYKAGLDIVIFGTHSYLSKSFDVVPKTIRDLRFNGLVGSRIYDTALIKATGIISEDEIGRQDAYLVTRGGSSYDKIKLPSIRK